MFRLKENLIYTGHEVRTSKKSGNTYTLVRFLDGKGSVFSCVAKCVIPSISQLDEVEVDIEVIPGRYNQINVLNIEKV